MPSLPAKIVAEFIGVFALVFIGVGTVVMAGSSDLGVLGSALAAGFVIITMYSAVAHISGGHFNPAVTLGMMITGMQRMGEGIIYWSAQVLGGMAALIVLKVIIPVEIVRDNEAWAADKAFPLLGDGISAGGGMLTEAIVTFFVVWVFFGVAVDRRGMPVAVAGIPIGLAYAMGVLMAEPISGGVLNPARSLGPMLAVGDFTDAWVFVIGPMLGGSAAALLYKVINSPETTPPGR